MNNIKIIFFNLVPFSSLFERKIDIDFYSQSFIVEHWDCAGIYYSDRLIDAYFSGNEKLKYETINTKKFLDKSSVLKAISELDGSTTIIFNLCRDIRHHSDDYWFLRGLKKNNVKYFVQKFENFELTSSGDKQKKWDVERLKKIKNPLKLIRNIRLRLNNFILQRDFGYYQYPSFFIGHGLAGRRYFSLHSRKNAFFVPIASPSISWENYSEQKESACKYCVFVDESIGYAPDAKLMNFDTTNNLSAYYIGMKSVFSYIEKKLGYEVIVAASGKVIYDSNPFGREIIYGATKRLINSSSLVIGHSSTALYQSILCGKPTFLVSDASLTSKKKREIIHFSSLLSLSIVDTSVKIEIPDFQDNFETKIEELFVEYRELADKKHQDIISKAIETALL